MFKLVAQQGVGATLQAAFTSAQIGASNSMYASIEEAATLAIREAGSQLKTEGRAEIAAAGFSKKWQNAWRVNFYPANGFSIDAAAYAYHNIPYSLVFENGATIRARAGLLWLPLPTVPKKGRRKQASARQLAQSGVKLFTIKRAGKKPLLATSLRGSRKGFPGDKAVSLAKLRKGPAGKNGVVQALPLFVGVPSVTIRKRFSLAGVAGSIRGRLGEIYFAKLKVA